ncbi:MAG: ATPase involved in replication initiation [Bacteroidetes bacterium]|nr:ATPase involved in replication initiation [Bacteroidota bacterium]
MPKKKKTQRQHKPKCYISGKISGLDFAEVKEKFARAEKEVRALGYIPINPLKNGVKTEAWGDHLTKDIADLNCGQAVYFLTDWEDSDGAKIEHIFSANSKKKMIYQPKTQKQ